MEALACHAAQHLAHENVDLDVLVVQIGRRDEKKCRPTEKHQRTSSDQDSDEFRT